MVRPKSSRAGNTKRNRTSFQEEKLNAKLRDFDMLADSLLANMETSVMDRNNEIERTIKTEKNRISKRILQMKMGDLRQTNAKTFAEVEELLLTLGDTTCSGDSSQLSLGSEAGKDKTDKKKLSKDEGYLTEGSVTGGNRSTDMLMASAKARGYGPLASAMKNRRRSKSISGSATSGAWGQQHSSLLVGIKSKKTFGGSQSLFGGADNTLRQSRSKFRTPVAAGGAGGSRLQTVSADRGMMNLIAPKVQPNTPLAILRHARVGESVYSTTGSPVITAAMVEECANVNIPVANGVLSIRPTEMDCVVDSGLLQKIDQDTLEHLKKLQINLNKIMQIAEEHHQKK